ncbi:MAG: fibronectin type III domain-containing protein [Actinomycetia bacterium]|nr:fibronectin type III domain-containing protein [Actinomycetes bacterium]
MSLRTRLLGLVGCTSLVFGGFLPASAAGVLFSDGFETGTTASWTSVRGVVVNNIDAFSGVYAAEAMSTGTAAYARKTLVTPTTSLDYALQFKLVSRGLTPVNVMAVRPSTGAPVAAVFLNRKGNLALRAGGVSTVSATVVGANIWHSLSLHVEVAGSASTTQVWLDGAATPTLTSTASLTTAVRQVEIGDPIANRTFDVRFDDVSVQDTAADDTSAPTAPANLTAVAVSDHQVNLSWVAATDDVGVTGYDVFRDSAQIASIRAGTTYADLSPTAEGTYIYQVRAQDAAGNISALSNSATVSTPPATSDSVQIAAAGDIACSPSGVVSSATCQQMATSDLLIGGAYDRVLTLGDNQYENGSLSNYLASYAPSWGESKA